MQASLQSTAGVLRVHPEGGLGTPYTWACAYVMCGTSVMLYGAMRAPTREEYRAIRQAFVDAGATNAVWERRKPHRAYTVHVEL